MGRLKTTEEFINDAVSIHGNRYDYSLVDYKNSTTKVTIICSDHGEFEQIPSYHLSKCGCPSCGIETTRLKNVYSIDTFKALSNKEHNYQYDYNDVQYINSQTPVSIICEIHGGFTQIPAEHISGSGCPSCGIDKNRNNQTKTTKQFIIDAKSVHGDRYDYPDPYVNSSSKIRIICSNHGEFNQLPSNHLAEHGCPECALEATSQSLLKTTSDFISGAKSVHGDRYDYQLVEYCGQNCEVSIICDIHGEFKQIPKYHLRGSGCSKCASNISTMSQKWLDHLQVPHREVSGLVANKRYVADGYDPVSNTVYEFHGDYWHGNPNVYQPNDVNPSTKTTYGELYENTQHKKKTFIDAGFNYVEMWETNWKNLEK